MYKIAVSSLAELLSLQGEMLITPLLLGALQSPMQFGSKVIPSKGLQAVVG